MNLILHHFFKEFRYLRLRWFAFLVLLTSELAVNLEWLLPMRAGVASPGWLAYLPVIVLLSGLSLLLSCPEDRPGTDRSFISTRPLPAQAYWMARVLIWLLLIVLPVVLQNGLYLVLSGRPFADVLRGMWERFCFAAGFSAWLLPMLVLWRRREMWKALSILALALIVLSKTLDVAAATWWKFYPSYMQEWSGLTAGWAVFAVLCGVVAWKHLTRGFTFRRRLTLTMLAASVALLTARFWSWRDSPPTSQNEALVKKLSHDLPFEVDLAETRFEGTERSFGPRLTSSITADTHKQGVHVVFRAQRSDFAQGGSTRHVESTERNPYRRSPYDSPQAEVFRGDHNLRDFFPKGSLLVAHDEYFPKWTLIEQPNTPLAVFEAPHPKFDQPLIIDTDFEADWYQRDIAIDIPVQAGARGACEDVRWEIMRLAPTGDTLNVALRMESRAHWDAPNGHAILLHLPQQRIVRLEPTKNTAVGERGVHTGWRHQQVELTWNHIFSHADGEPTSVEISQARLMLLRSRYLGQSRHHWKSPEITLTDFPSNFGGDLHWDYSDALYKGREMKAFQERMATFTPPTAQSSEKEARRYVYDLFSTASATQAVYTYAAHPLIAQSFEPLGRHQLPLMLDLRSQTWPGWSNKPPNNQLERYVTEDQREILIDRAAQSYGLADLVVNKGWSEEAKRLEPQMLAMHHLSRSAERLLMSWSDEKSNTRLLKQVPYDINGYIVQHLDKTPALRPQLESTVRKEFESVVPLVGSQSYYLFRISQAANFGSEAAFDLCLRWLSIGGDLPPRIRSIPEPMLLNADGTNFWKKRMPAHEQWPFFRRLKVSAFEYVPEKRAWKFRQP